MRRSLEFHKSRTLLTFTSHRNRRRWISSAFKDQSKQTGGAHPSKKGDYTDNSKHVHKISFGCRRFLHQNSASYIFYSYLPNVKFDDNRADNNNPSRLRISSRKANLQNGQSMSRFYSIEGR